MSGNVQRIMRPEYFFSGIKQWSVFPNHLNLFLAIQSYTLSEILPGITRKTCNTLYGKPRIPDILNYISINMTGSISGPYCNNTLALVDNCRLLSTELNTDVEPDMNTTYINCDYLGNRQTTYFTFQNKSLTLNWGECAMTAEPKILAQYGSYLKPIIMLLVLIFLLI